MTAGVFETSNFSPHQVLNLSPDTLHQVPLSPYSGRYPSLVHRQKTKVRFIVSNLMSIFLSPLSLFPPARFSRYIACVLGLSDDGFLLTLEPEKYSTQMAVPTDNQIIYDCTRCRAQFQTYKELEDHKANRMKEGNGHIHCKVCGSFFRIQYSLTEHIKEVGIALTKLGLS